MYVQSNSRGTFCTARNALRKIPPRTCYCFTAASSLWMRKLLLQTLRVSIFLPAIVLLTRMPRARCFWKTNRFARDRQASRHCDVGPRPLYGLHQPSQRSEVPDDLGGWRSSLRLARLLGQHDSPLTEFRIAGWSGCPISRHMGRWQVFRQYFGRRIATLRPHVEPNMSPRKPRTPRSAFVATIPETRRAQRNPHDCGVPFCEGCSRSYDSHS